MLLDSRLLRQRRLETFLNFPRGGLEVFVARSRGAGPKPQRWPFAESTEAAGARSIRGLRSVRPIGASARVSPAPRPSPRTEIWPASIAVIMWPPRCSTSPSVLIGTSILIVGCDRALISG